MSVTVVEEEPSLARLWPKWQALWQRAAGAVPFLAPAWMRPWWQVFGTGRPLVAVLHDDSVLAGVLPLYRLNDKLLPMGVGISDQFDVLLAPDAPWDAAEQLLAAALRAGGAQVCDLPELPPGSALLRVAPPAGWRASTWVRSACPVLPLQPEPAIPKGMRRDLRQARHRAERAGGWRVERAGAESWPEVMANLMRLHRARWQARDQPGVLADPLIVSFHRAAGPELIAAGLLRLEALRFGERVVGVIHALLSDRDIYFYLSGFDPAAGFESPGTILLGHMIEAAALEGRLEAHFLRGEERYKYAWGGVNRLNAGRSFAPE